MASWGIVDADDDGELKDEFMDYIQPDNKPERTIYSEMNNPTGKTKGVPERLLVHCSEFKIIK